MIFDPDLPTRLEPPPAKADDHANRFRAEAFRDDRALSSPRFQAWLDDGLPSGVFRAKGLVRFEGIDGIYLFQLCGVRAAFEPAQTAVEIDGVELVFIGPGINRAEISRRLEECLVANPRPAESQPA